jgi:hypothetical protein
VQNAAVRLVAGANKFDHVTPLLRERHWLPVWQRINFKIAVLMFKCLHGMSADYLTEYIRLPASTVSGRRLRSTTSGRLLVPRSRTSVGDRSFAVAGPRVWNSLPASITTAGSLTIFRQHLKTFLFRTAYK